MNRIHEFTFRIVPWYYQGAGRSVDSFSKELQISVSINGLKHNVKYVVFDPLIWETEIEHYVRLAVEELHKNIRDEGEWESGT